MIAKLHRFISETYSPSTLLIKHEYWFWQLKNDDFERQSLGQSKMFKDAKLQTLLDENSTRMLEKIS